MHARESAWVAPESRWTARGGEGEETEPGDQTHTQLQGNSQDGETEVQVRVKILIPFDEASLSAHNVTNLTRLEEKRLRSFNSSVALTFRLSGDTTPFLWAIKFWAMKFCSSALPWSASVGSGGRSGAA